MFNMRLGATLFALGLVLQGCTATSTQRMIDTNDHAGLASRLDNAVKLADHPQCGERGIHVRIPADRDHPFQAIVITHSRAS